MAETMLLLAAISAAVASPADDGATLQPSMPADVASAVGNCWLAVGAAGVDRSRLESDGWSLLAETADEAVSPLEALTKRGANHRILLARAPEAKSFCAVVARVSSQDDARSALTAIQQALQSFGTKAPASRSGDGVVFLSSPRFAQVDLTDAAGGTEEQPGLRIVVGYEMAEQK